MSSRARAAAAGAVAAVTWGLLEPLDKPPLPLLRHRRARKGGDPRERLAAARFRDPCGERRRLGLTYDELRRRTGLPGRPLAFSMAMTEHLALYPLSWFVDRFHPARGEEGLPPLLTNGRAFVQATWRHAVFGVVLGALATSRGRSR